MTRFTGRLVAEVVVLGAAACFAGCANNRGDVLGTSEPAPREPVIVEQDDESSAEVTQRERPQHRNEPRAEVTPPMPPPTPRATEMTTPEWWHAGTTAVESGVEVCAVGHGDDLRGARAGAVAAALTRLSESLDGAVGEYEVVRSSSSPDRMGGFRVWVCVRAKKG